MPLVHGKYHATNPYWTALGQPANASQGSTPVRSNFEYIGAVAITDGAALTTQVCTAVPIPVEIGDVITKVTVLVGATAAGTPTNAFAALYSGIATPALLAQSTDITSTAIAASAAFTFTLASPVQVTPTNAPNGYIYASVMSKATTVPTLVSVTVAAAAGYAWFPNSPLFFSASHGSALTATAPGTIATPTTKATVPLVFLS